MNNNESIISYIKVADLISSLNLISGFISVIFAINNNFALSSLFIILAIIFDCTDGWVARKLNQADDSDFGKNMDSLSDALSFGLAPGILLYQLGNQLNPELNIITIIISAYILWTGVLRLARFNTMKTNKPGFIGLPIPATALILAIFYLTNIFDLYIAYILMIIASTLMISKIKYPKIYDKRIIVIMAILLILTPLQILIFNINIPPTLLLILILIYLIPKKQEQ